MFNQIIKKLFILVSAFIALSLFSSNILAAPEVGKTYFTKYNFMFEKNRHVTTNYWRGQMVPVNSKVEVLSFDSKKMDILYNGQKVTILNVPKFSKKSMDEIADNLLSDSPVSISGKFTNSILNGQLRIGMSKDEVIMTRGYPPAHKTYSTEADLWVYWSSKFVQLSIEFTNGKLSRGRGIR